MTIMDKLVILGNNSVEVREANAMLENVLLGIDASSKIKMEKEGTELDGNSNK